jgi:hypothetical protein
MRFKIWAPVLQCHPLCENTSAVSSIIVLSCTIMQVADYNVGYNSKNYYIFR